MSSRCLFRLVRASRIGTMCQSRSLHIQRLLSHRILNNRNITMPNYSYCQTRGLCASAVKFEMFNVQDTDDFKKRVMESPTPVVVDFHATWCGPCKILGPRLESILSQKEGRVALAKVDVDENAELAIQHAVASVPTVVGIKNGKVIDKFVGLIDDDKLNTFVETLIN